MKCGYLDPSSVIVTDHGLLTGLSDDDHALYLLANGTRGLSADWDAGSWQIRAETFQSDVATGTAPLTVTSTTVVTNLNADLLDGYHAAAFQLTLTNPVTGTGTSGYLPKFTGTSTIGDSAASEYGPWITANLVAYDYTIPAGHTAIHNNMQVPPARTVTVVGLLVDPGWS